MWKFWNFGTAPVDGWEFGLWGGNTARLVDAYGKRERSVVWRSSPERSVVNRSGDLLAMLQNSKGTERFSFSVVLGRRIRYQAIYRA